MEFLIDADVLRVGELVNFIGQDSFLGASIFLGVSLDF